MVDVSFFQQSHGDQRAADSPFPHPLPFPIIPFPIPVSCGQITNKDRLDGCSEDLPIIMPLPYSLLDGTLDGTSDGMLETEGAFEVDGAFDTVGDTVWCTGEKKSSERVDNIPVVDRTMHAPESLSSSPSSSTASYPASSWIHSILPRRPLPLLVERTGPETEASWSWGQKMRAMAATGSCLAIHRNLRARPTETDRHYDYFKLGHNTKQL